MSKSLRVSDAMYAFLESRKRGRIRSFEDVISDMIYRKGKGGKSVSYICQECGTQYGDPSLDSIPIICSNCVDGGEDDVEEDEGEDEE
jgi:hypothetical protein